MHNPLVSILIANYNNSQYIVETLDSVIVQTYTNIEIIIVDDASQDNSISIISEYILTHPNFNIKLYKNNHNYGCGRNKRKCTEIASGELFAFLDPEDTISSDCVEKMVEKHCENNQLSIVYCSQYLCDSKLTPLTISTYPGQIPQGESHLTSKKGKISALAMVNKYYYDMTSGIDPKFIVAEDQDMYLKLEEVAPVLFINEPLYFYRKHDNNISYDNKHILRNKYWLMIAREDAYKRRLSNRSIVNLKLLDLYKIRQEYYILLAQHTHGIAKYKAIINAMAYSIFNPRKFIKYIIK